MTIDYLKSPRGHAPEADYAIHLGDPFSRTTTCGRDARDRLLTMTLERVTCRDCRARIREA